jgi:hypothetical protein
MPPNFCMPKVNSWDQSSNKCPVYCNTTTEKTCYVPQFGTTLDISQFGSLKWTEFCSAKDTPCDCNRGTNAKYCAYYDDCFHKDEYCPVACEANQVVCPPVTDYDGAGKALREREPKSEHACAANFNACTCGAGATQCVDEFGEKYCQAQTTPCPTNCNADQEICEIVDYVSDTSNEMAKIQEKCISKNSTCPCGTHSHKCAAPDGDYCMPKSDKAEFCPCTAAQTVCTVEDFTKEGKSAGFRDVCVTKGSTCPCGNNGKACTTAGICIPEQANGRATSCPAPCLPADEAQGKATCAVVSLNKQMEVKSSSVTCKMEGQCEPGEGQKKCPTGAQIMSYLPCKDIYGLLTAGSASGGRRMSKTRGGLWKIAGRRMSNTAPKVAATTKQTATLKFSLDNLVANAAGNAVQTAKVKIDSLLQLLPVLQSDLTMQKGSSEAAMTYTVSNQGSSAVTPKKVTETLREKLNSGTKDYSDALKPIGSVKTGSKGCCTLGTSSETVSDRVVAPSPVAPAAEGSSDPTPPPTPPPQASGETDSTPPPPPPAPATTASPGRRSLPQLAALLLMSLSSLFAQL